MTLRQILARRAEVRTEMQTILDATPDGPLPEAAEHRYAELEAEATALAVRETRQAALDDAARQQPGRAVTETRAPDGPAFDGGYLATQDGHRIPVLEARHNLASLVSPEQRGADISFGAFLRSLYSGPRSPDERRAMAEASIGTGGAMVPTPLAAGIIDNMRSASVAFRAGVRTIPMESQSLKFARVLSDPVGSWRAEASPITEGQPTLDQVTLNAKSWALITRVSRELLEDGQNTDAVLRDLFAKSAALALDRAILFGPGSAVDLNHPLGVANTPGVQIISMGTNGAKLAGWASVLDAVAALEAVNAGTVSAMIAAPRTARSIYGFVDSTGQPLSLPPRLVGIPLLTTTSVNITETQGSNNDTSSMVLGDFSQVYCGLRTSLQVSVLNERYADTGQVGFVSWLRADVLVARPAALARIEGISAT